ncbi:Taurine catabolism dioxygenase TauD/TfdA [Lasallia pustulata]|uniref:Taurine catabolism dioxygenase TauD/TfdA n=1 Tax=Lasallia pustulata TaxID=136370 RepID=A0A1W5CUK1_9LECA|nr:Taurine catabolism dioxygenase TauD/TfdA [Lasallia pustulata]
MAQVLAIQSELSFDPHKQFTGLRSRYFAATPNAQILRHVKNDAPEDHGVLADTEIRRPSIRFQPSWEDYSARSKRVTRQRSNFPGEALPEGFPPLITGPRTWSGRDIATPDKFTFQLSSADLAEIESALAQFKDLPGTNGPDQVSRDLFPLPILGRTLGRISEDLHKGCGVAILRGLNPKVYTPWENVILFTGLASYLGEQRGCQDEHGNMLTHLVDMGFKFGHNSKRSPAFDAGALPFHNDVCDLLAMYVQDCASSGGESLLASSAAVYNEIAATRPDVIKTLAEPVWVYDKDKAPAVWPGRAILFPESEQGPFFCFSRAKITGSETHPLSPSLPAMTEAQAEALDMVHFIAEKHAIVVKSEPGDILLCNNLALLHGRKAFSDAASDNRRRHIIRLWLRNKERAWHTPKGLERDWSVVYGNSERRTRMRWMFRPEDVEKERVIGHKITCS